MRRENIPGDELNRMFQLPQNAPPFPASFPKADRANREGWAPPSQGQIPPSTIIKAAEPIARGFQLGGAQGEFKVPHPGGGCIVWNPVLVPIPTLQGIDMRETGVSFPSPGGDWRECLFDWGVALFLAGLILAGIVLLVLGAAGQTVGGRLKGAVRGAIE